MKHKRNKGIAMVLVLGVVAASSILAYAMLANAAMQAQVSKSIEDRIQRKYLAESGLNLALYYLQNPSASPVSLVYGTYGNVHYPGETNTTITGMEGALTITVTNTSNGYFDITSAATLNGITSTGHAKVKLNKSRTFSYGGNFRGNLSLSNNTNLSGGLITDGSVTKNSATVSGTIVASNGQTLGGTNYSGSAISYPMTAMYYMPYYFYNGNRYTAKSLGNTYTGGTLFDSDTTNNPANVWYSSNGTTITGNTTLNGTLIVASNKDLTLTSTITINPVSNMPAAVFGRRLTMNGGNRTFNGNGIVYVSDTIRGSGASGTSTVNITGALVGNVGGWPVDSGFSGALNVSYNSSRNRISGFADELENIDSVEIKQWSIDN